MVLVSDALKFKVSLTEVLRDTRLLDVVAEGVLKVAKAILIFRYVGSPEKYLSFSNCVGNPC